MGILDSIIGNVKADLAQKASRGISETISKGVGDAIKKGGNSCPKCGKPIPAERPKFCPSCGAALVSSCSKCKADYPLGTKFCPSCGSKLSAS